MALPGITAQKIEGSAVGVLPGISAPVCIGPIPANQVGSPTSVQPGNVYTITNTPGAFNAIGYNESGYFVANMITKTKVPVFFVPTTGSNAAPSYAASYTSSSVGPSTRFLLSGTATSPSQVVANVVLGGTTFGGVQMNFSLDGGVSATGVSVVTSPVPSSYVVSPGSEPQTFVTQSIGNGLYALISGSVATNDTFSAKAFPPRLSSADLASAATTIVQNRQIIGQPQGVYVIGQPRTTTEANDLIAGCNTLMSTLESKLIFTQCFLQTCPPISSSISNFVGRQAEANAFSQGLTQVATTGETITCVNADVPTNVPGGVAGYTTPMLGAYFGEAARFASVDVSTDPTEFDLGPITDWAGRPTWDEDVDGQVFTAKTVRCEAPRTYPNGQGFYPTNDANRCPTSSVYTTWDRGQVINVAVRTCINGLQKYINKNVKAMTDGTGRLAARVKAKITTELLNLLSSALMQPANKDSGEIGHVSGFSFNIIDTNILQTGQLVTQVQIVPLAKITNILITLTFVTNLQTGATTVTAQ